MSAKRKPKRKKVVKRRVIGVGYLYAEASNVISLRETASGGALVSMNCRDVLWGKVKLVAEYA